MGHVGGVIANVRFCTPPRSTVFGYERDIDGTYVRRRFSIASEAQRTHELPNTIAFLANPDLADHRHRNGILSFAYLTLRSPLGELVTPAAQRLSVAGGGVPGRTADSAARTSVRAHLMNVARDCPSVARFAVGFGTRRFLAGGRKIPGFFSAYSGENCYPLQYHGEQIPNRQSRVSLASDRDSVGMPRLNIDLRFSQADVDGILRCHEVWDEYLRKNGCGRLEYVSPDPSSAVWSRLGAGSHQLGTTRMASKAEDGVVNEHLAVHGMANLFVASSSVLLTSSQANPTFMVIVLALRLADRLKLILGGPVIVQKPAANGPLRLRSTVMSPSSLGGLGTASPLKLRVARIVASDKAGRLIAALSGYRVRHHGLWFNVRSSDFSPEVRAQMFWGAYESAETRMIRGLLRGSTTVVELGSSLGVTSAHIAALMAPGGHLVCVEANPRLLPGLSERLTHRIASLRVDFVHAAVTGHCGEAVLALSPKTVGSRLGAVRPHDAAVGVPALTLGEILRRTGIRNFDLVSDIEGAESAFLLQDPDALRECRRAVIELHDTTVDGRAVSISELLEAATAAGLRVIGRHGPVVGLVRPR